MQEIDYLPDGSFQPPDTSNNLTTVVDPEPWKTSESEFDLGEAFEPQAGEWRKQPASVDSMGYIPDGSLRFDDMQASAAEVRKAKLEARGHSCCVECQSGGCCSSGGGSCECGTGSDCDPIHQWLAQRADEPPIILLEQDKERRRLPKTKCGPDITDWFLKILGDFLGMVVFRPPRVPGPGSGAAEAGYEAAMHSRGFSISRAGGLVDLKPPKRGVVPGCPRGEPCQKTVTLCDYCIDDDVPGNISFGLTGSATIGRKNTLNLSNTTSIKEYGWPDPPGDVSALNLGADLLAVSGKNMADLRKNLKKKLCELLGKELKAAAKRAAAGSPRELQDKKKICPLCRVPYKKHPKGSGGPLGDYY